MAISARCYKGRVIDLTAVSRSLMVCGFLSVFDYNQLALLLSANITSIDLVGMNMTRIDLVQMQESYQMV